MRMRIKATAPPPAKIYISIQVAPNTIPVSTAIDTATTNDQWKTRTSVSQTVIQPEIFTPASQPYAISLPDLGDIIGTSRMLSAREHRPDQIFIMPNAGKNNASNVNRNHRQHEPGQKLVRFLKPI